MSSEGKAIRKLLHHWEGRDQGHGGVRWEGVLVVGRNTTYMDKRVHIPVQ